ncbi:MAG: hypothetical protein KVP17_000596 [Porospora cf. gigantea B]|uniref:uncharacterized protein n=1 Tax=Porospora cf. gigantea B TaxID=2853592 RepID=UPI003571C61F|nr:MAG: hypothetical protein KVP17_000596 [Porospora cf. gigantea B]
MRVNITTACVCAAAQCSTSEKLDVVLLLDSDLFEAAPSMAEELRRLDSVINAPDARYAMVSFGSKDIFASSDHHWVYKRESFFSDDLLSVTQRLLNIGRPHDYNNSPLSAVADALACCVHDPWLGYREGSRKVFVLLNKGFTLSSEDFTGWLLPEFSCSALSFSQPIERLTWLRELRDLDDGFFWSVYDLAEDNEAQWFDEYLRYLPYWFYAKEADDVPRQLEQIVSEAMCAADLTPWVPFDLPTLPPNPPPSTTASGGTSDTLNTVISDAKTAGGVAVVIASGAAALYSVSEPI